MRHRRAARGRCSCRGGLQHCLWLQGTAPDNRRQCCPQVGLLLGRAVAGRVHGRALSFGALHRSRAEARQGAEDRHTRLRCDPAIREEHRRPVQADEAEQWRDVLRLRQPRPTGGGHEGFAVVGGQTRQVGQRAEQAEGPHGQLRGDFRAALPQAQAVHARPHCRQPAVLRRAFFAVRARGGAEGDSHRDARRVQVAALDGRELRARAASLRPAVDGGAAQTSRLDRCQGRGRGGRQERRGDARESAAGRREGELGSAPGCYRRRRGRRGSGGGLHPPRRAAVDWAHCAARREEAAAAACLTGARGHVADADGLRAARAACGARSAA
mmetsp:Transcript_39572/g.92497  ORF Transcript_39572/g.92497 Transcript_39572/m.92497 type:complete len:327 (+) Transcript_39572:126-1106(+)